MEGSSLFDTVTGVVPDLVRVLGVRLNFLEQSFQEFQSAVRCSVGGDIALGLEHLERTRHLEIREWFKSAGQKAGMARFAALGRRKAREPECPKGSRAESDVGKKLARDVLERDRYHCRYCDVPVIYTDEANRLRDLFGGSYFKLSQDNDLAHGTLRAFYNSFDHVVPVSRGGQNKVNNIVTACYACNFGKANYTLYQLGLTDPFLNPIAYSDHDGFVSLLESAPS